VYVAGADGGGLRSLVTDPANDTAPSWSRDGKWIYFHSAHTGDEEVWKIPAAGGEAVRVTDNGGSLPFESHDGKFVYYLKESGANGLWRIPTGGGPEEQVLQSRVGNHNYAVARSGVYFIPAGGRTLQFLNPSTGETKTVARIGPQIGNGVSVSPDERRILYTRGALAGADLMLVENFR
jgi:Tol biopolymer transport system component